MNLEERVIQLMEDEADRAPLTQEQRPAPLVLAPPGLDFPAICSHISRARGHGHRGLWQGCSASRRPWEKERLPPATAAASSGRHAAAGQLRHVDAGDAIVCVTRWHALGTGSGLAVDQTFAEVYEFEDGQIVRATLGYPSRADALQALGLEE
jgi:hypothetical protein